MDLNPNLLKRKPEFYEQIQELRSPDIFVVKYIPTGNRFVLRKTKLIECLDLELYENEVDLANQLKHKNLLPFVSSFISATDLWVILPFAEFQSFADLSTPFGLTEGAIALIMKDVLNGVQYLHNNCIIHHSIRASHVLLFGTKSTHFRCVLSGLKYSISAMKNGKVLTPNYAYPVLTETNINWLAPEVLEQNLMGYDVKADIYSIGITCCELSNGSIPFAGLEPSEVLLNKLNGEIPEPLDSNSEDLKQLTEYGGAEALTPKMQLKLNSYRHKKYSKEFKKFTIKCCLHPEPDKRLNATELLSHPFIRRYENLDKTKVFIESIRKNELTDNIRHLL